MFAIDRDAADAGQHMRHDYRVVLGQVGHYCGRYDMGQREQAQAARFAGLRPPTHEITFRATFRQPVRQRLQEGRPRCAGGVGDNDMAHQPMQFAAQPGDERRMAPARLQLPARRDTHLAREDVRVGALQTKEGGLQAEPQQSAGHAEVVVGGCRQQMYAGSVTT